MKANLKGLGGIKHLLLVHGEKLGIVVVGICAAMMIYQSLVRDRLPADKQADRLTDQINLARRDMDEYTWDKIKADHPDQVRLFKPLEQKGNNTVDPTKYVGPYSQIGWDSPVVPPTVLRIDPVLLEAQDLEARGGSGLLAFVDPEVRKRKILEEQKKAAELSSKQKKELEKQQEDEGRNTRNRGRAGQGNEGYGADAYDPEHPKRKAVVGMVRPAGVPLQDYEEVKVAHWAVVVAKVPIKEQLKLYRDAFENARDSSLMADVPQYLGYVVERAEVRPGDEGKELTWQAVSVYDGKSTIPIATVVSADAIYGKQDNAGTNPAAQIKKAVTTDWAAVTPDVVDPRYLGVGPLVFPLPPLVGRDWGREVTHSEVPLAIDAVEPEEETKPEPAKVATPADGEPTDLFSGAATPGGGMPSQQSMAGGRGGYGMGEGGGRGYSGRGGYGMGGEMGGRGGYGAGGYGAGGYGEGGYGMGGPEGGRGYAGAGTGGMGPNGEPQAPHWLLRFFDFSVQPGLKYKYRVRLAMLDPNQSFGSRYVSPDSLDQTAQTRIKKEKAARKSRPNAPPPTPFRWTEWSKPTAPVSIPLAGSVKVASAKPVTDKFNDEPSATLLVESFGRDEKGNAVQVAEEESFRRGNVANMTKDTKMLVEQNRAYDPISKFPFRTGITVVDIHGGERVTRETVRPARVLLMGPAGQLFVQDETEDAESIEMHKAAFSEEESGAAGGFYGGAGYEGRGGPEGRGR